MAKPKAMIPAPAQTIAFLPYESDKCPIIIIIKILRIHCFINCDKLIIIVPDTIVEGMEVRIKTPNTIDDMVAGFSDLIISNNKININHNNSK